MAHELLAARAARIRRIRHRVIAGTVAAFALAWGVVAFDGSMGAETTTTAQATTTTTTTDAAATATPTATSTDDTQTSSDDSATSTDDGSSTLSTSQS
jgi:hypothetical protein